MEIYAHSLGYAMFFFFNDTAPTELYTLSLHDALPICRLCRGMGTPHEFDVGPAMTTRPRPTSAAGGLALQRQMMFWLAALAVFILLLWLLSDILLPFFAGFAIAYLLNPLIDRIERLGVPRLAVALLIIVVVVMALVLLVLLVAPLLGGQMSSFLEKIPDYVSKLQSLLNDQSRPWVQKLTGAGFDPEKSLSGLVSQGSAYF